MDSLAASERFTVYQEEGPQSAPLDGDPGGDTNWGITLARLSEWRGYKCAPSEVYALTYDEAAAIFHTGYYNALRCDAMWPGLDLMVADHGFNCGLGSSSRVLQTILTVDVDGRIGPKTLGAVGMVNDHKAFLARLRLAQETDYRSKGNFDRFGLEWIGDPAGRDDWHIKGRLGRRYEAALTLVSP